MNLKHILPVAILALVTSTPSMAQEATPDVAQQPASPAPTLSRAEVQAAAIAAVRDGLIDKGEALLAIDSARSVLPRAQVKAEAREAVRLNLNRRGEVGALATQAELDQVRQAGLRAVQGELIANR